MTMGLGVLDKLCTLMKFLIFYKDCLFGLIFPVSCY